MSHDAASPTKSLSRREFLAVSGTGIAASAGLRAVCADDVAMRPKFTFALITDTHLGRSAAEERNLPKIVAEVNQSDAAFTMFCGDLVDNGQKPENEGRYATWMETAKNLKRDWFAVPGNHDPDALFVKHVRPETDFAFDHEGVSFICFRNAQPNPGHDGIVTPEQFKWLDARLADAKRKGQRVILVAHLIYHKNQHPDVGWYIKEGREEFGRLLENNEHVVAFLAGHFHCGFRGWDDSSGVHEIILPSASWNANRGLAKAPGYSLNEFRIGHMLCDVFSDKLRLRYKPLGAEVAATQECRLRMS